MPTWIKRTYFGLRGWKKVLLWDLLVSAGGFLVFFSWNFFTEKEFSVPEILFILAWFTTVSNGLLILMPLAKAGSPKYWRGFDPFPLVMLVNLVLALGFRVSFFLWNSIASDTFLVPEAYLGAGLWMFLALGNGLWASYLRRNS